MRVTLLKVLGVLTLVALTCCGKVEEKDARFPRSQTLFIGGRQWGEATTFNPLTDWPAWPSGDQVNLLFESLLSYNLLTGKPDPLLAESYRYEANGISVYLNPKAKWNDGTPVTAKDVVFSFEIGKRYKNVKTSYVWAYISKIVVDPINPNKITFLMSNERNNPLMVMDILVQTNIVPEHVYEKMLQENKGDISEVKRDRGDVNPVGSGPYTLLEDSPEKIILKRDSNYWGNEALYGGRLPAPEYIIHPIYKSNENYSLALQQGKLDISETFIPRIWLKARKGVKTWFDKPPYFIPGSIPMFVINTTKPPLNDVRFRRAMGFGINYRDIRELAVSGYSDSLNSGLILPFGKEGKYFHKEDAEKYGVRYDKEKAKEILKEAGYISTFDSDGKLVEMRGPDGAVIPTLYIKSPSGWSDYESIVIIAVKSMREAGIDVRQKFIDVPEYDSNRPLGKFDLILDNPMPDVLPSSPWSRIEVVTTSRDWKPVGEIMKRSYGRYRNAEVDSLLARIPLLKNEDEKIRAYRRLNQIMMQELPVIPVVYRPQMYYEFSEKHWNNLPTEINPYAPPTSLSFGSGIHALWEIKPVEQK
ncbi:MAG: ABC transporter substrate-binding protein [Fibrobacterales bacterium]